jgi:hypothetical protein
MDQDGRTKEGASPQVDSTPIPSALRVLRGSLWVGALLVVGLPLLVWWQFGVLREDQRGLWTSAVSLAYILLVNSVSRRTHVPGPRPTQYVARDRVEWILGSASSTVTVPQDPQLRAAAGAVAIWRIELAAFVFYAAVAFALTGVLRWSSFWGFIAGLLTVFALVLISRARRSWVFLTLLHAEERPHDPGRGHGLRRG